MLVGASTMVIGGVFNFFLIHSANFNVGWMVTIGQLACSVCHYGFPQLTPFGRLFKLNGYTLTGLTTIDAGNRLSLAMRSVPGSYEPKE